MKVDLALAATAQRVARRHGHRASEVYAIGARLVAGGMARDRVEWLLVEIADLGRGMTFKEAAILAAKVADEGRRR